MPPKRRESVSTDDMLHVLAHVQRRRLLIELLESDSPLFIADLEREAYSPERPVLMYHVHVPKMADYGVIEWNQEMHEVARGPTFDAIRPLLELLNSHEDELPDDWL